MRKTLLTILPAIICLLNSLTVIGQKRIVIYPYGNGYMQVEGYDSSQWWEYTFSEADKANGFQFKTILLSDSTNWKQTFQPAGKPNPNPVIMEAINVWDVASLTQANGQQKKRSLKLFARDLTELLGDDLKMGKETPFSVYHAYDNLSPFTYRGVHCQLLWDTPEKCSRTYSNESSGNGSISYFSYDFDYSLRDAKQIALCRYSDKCYVLLLLTQNVIESEQHSNTD